MPLFFVFSKDTSWPDTLPGYTVQTSTNLVRTNWLTLTNRPTLIINKYFFTHSTTGTNKFFRLEQGPDFYR